MTPAKILTKYVVRALLLREEDSMGLCVSCGAEACQVEPDAREYECDVCGEPSVYGAEEIVIQWGGF